MTEGSAIRRIGYLRWLRNISVALGNAPYEDKIIIALTEKTGLADWLDEHILWAVARQYAKRDESRIEIQTSQQKRLIRAISKGLPRDA